MSKGNSNNRYPGKRDGQRLKIVFSCGDSKVEKMRDFEKILDQINQHRSMDDQVVLSGNLRTLLEHLEKGEVHYMTEMSVPSSLENKPFEVITTLRTFLKGDERLWIVHHKTAKHYVWGMSCDSVKNAFSTFHIYSCDNVVALS